MNAQRQYALGNFENQRVLKMHIFILSTLILRELGLQKYFSLTTKNLLSPGCGQCMGCAGGGGGGGSAGVTVCCVFCDGNWLVAVGVVCVMPSRFCIM